MVVTSQKYISSRFLRGPGAQRFQFLVPVPEDAFNTIPDGIIFHSIIISKVVSKSSFDINVIVDLQAVSKHLDLTSCRILTFATGRSRNVLLDKIQRALFGFLEDAADVLADHAKAN